MSETENKLIAFIDSLEPEFKRVQVDNILFEKEAHFAKQALLSNEYLLNTARGNPQALKDAIINIASIGLSLNPAQQHAYLVPRNKQICLDISYKGLIKSATDTGSILWAQAELVYEKDEFTLMGVGEKPIHKFNPFCKERGELIGCYVVAKTHEGDFLTTPMAMEEIYSIRDKSEAFKKGYGPWKEFEGEMVKKTVIKRASKLWPRTNKSIQLEKAIEVLNKDEGIDFVNHYQEEKKALEEDFPIPPEDKEVGERYMIMNGKYRGKRFGELEDEKLEEYYDILDERINKPDHKKAWELELHCAIREYFELRDAA